MHEGKTIGAILLMGGDGRRFGSNILKQFQLLGKKPLYTHALDTILSTKLFDEIVLVCHSKWMNIKADGITLVTGGSTRQESSYRGLLAFKKAIDIVLIHDAVRPLVTESILRENVKEAIKWGAIDTCIPTADTLVYAPTGNVITNIPKREEYLRGQTPQTFHMEWILEAHEQARLEGSKNASDDCSLIMRFGKHVHIVAGAESNLKITTELDLFIAEQLINSRTRNFH